MRLAAATVAVVAVGLASAAPVARDVSEVKAAIAGLPCRFELVALAMSYASLQGCLGTAGPSAKLCEGQAYQLLTTAGEVLQKKECADGYSAFIQKYVINIDMTRIFKTVADLADCSKSKAIEECKAEAIPVLKQIGADFSDELLKDSTAEWKANAVNTAHSLLDLGKCVGGAPKLQATLSADEYTKFVAKVQPSLDKMAQAVENAKHHGNGDQQYLGDRLLEMVQAKAPFAIESVPKLKAEDIPDVRQCKDQWTVLRANLTTFLSSAETPLFAGKVLDRVPLLTSLRPYLDAFVATRTEIATEVLPIMDCQFTWTTVDDLDTCTAGAVDHVTTWTNHLQAALPTAPADPAASGAASISVPAPSDATPIPTPTPAEAIPTPTEAPPTPTEQPASPSAPVASLGTDESAATQNVEESSGHPVLKTLGMLLLIPTLAAGTVYGGLQVYQRRHQLQLIGLRRGGFRRVAQTDDAPLDLDSETLLNELTDSEDDEPLDL